jgi:prepilin-type processing-associated H-X9-DG protein
VAIPINYWANPSASYNGTPNNVSFAGEAGSQHSGGCHVVLCDGGVRFVNQNLDWTVRKALSTISFNETNTDF